MPEESRSIGTILYEPGSAGGQGGYEGGGAMVWYGQPSPWAAGVEDVVAAAVQDQVKKVRGR